MNSPPYWPPPRDWQPDPDQPAPKPPARKRAIPAIAAGFVLGVAAIAAAFLGWREAWNHWTGFDTAIWLLLGASAILLASAVLVASAFRRLGILIALLVTPLWFGFAALVALYGISGGNTG